MTALRPWLRLGLSLAATALPSFAPANAQVLPRAFLLHTLPSIATPKLFAHVPKDQENELLGYGLLGVDARHYSIPESHGQLKFTTAAFGWRTVPQRRGLPDFHLELGFDFARWRPLRSHGLGEKELSLSPSQRSPVWAIDRLRLSVPVGGDFRLALVDTKAEKGFIRSPLGWPAPGWVAVEPPVLALEVSRQQVASYEGRVWVGQGIVDAANILEGGMSVAGYISEGILGYSRGTMSEGAPDKASFQNKTMVRSDWHAGIISDGRWPLAYGLYFGVGFGGSSGDTDRPLVATIAGRCYQCYAKFQRYQRNIVMGYATYFILAKYFIHIEGQDLDQKVGKRRVTDHYSYQAVGQLLNGGELGFLSLGYYRGHRQPYPAIAPDSLEPPRPAYVLRWGIGVLGGTPP